ncbi:DUF6293 family protein [Haloglomus litoreum]|uniref:HFX_2341 family transcriptional regulator domain-containing protein n=1 Tax=Haloglomus litoreum TaxID=3034026 RepID=UPI0023E7B11A|nr:DUF6293 family protein [Haloglomus sp. DT116]
MHPERVHVVPLRDERRRALEPLLAERADRVHLLPHDGGDGSPDARDATGGDSDRRETSGTEAGGSSALDTVAGELRTAGVDVSVHPVDQFDVYAVFGLVTTLAARHADDEVYVNVSTGTRLAAIGAALGCMDVATDATPYHAAGDATVEEPRDAAQPTSGSGGGRPVATYPVDSLTRSQVATLAVVAVEDDDLKAPTKRRLIDRLVGLELALDRSLAVGARIVENADGVAHTDTAAGFDDLDANDRKSAYRTLDSVALGRLTDEGHVTVREAGRSKEVELTEQGENALRAFRHKIPDVVRELDRPGMPDWLREGL